MPITEVRKDPGTLTLTVIAEYPVPVRRVWDAYCDPRQLEKFWGPPEWPATFTRHDMTQGGRSDYRMTGPQGESSHGYWEFLLVEAPRRFEVIDGFAHPDGSPNVELPTTRMSVGFEPIGEGSRVTTVSTFNSLDELEELVRMGMEEGLRTAMAQIDAVVADLSSFAAGNAVQAQILGDTQVRTGRVIRGDLTDVWRAHHDPDIMKRWLLGPDGWTMPVCEVAVAVGERYRYEWENDAGNRFGFTGELLASSPPRRAVTTEILIGGEAPVTVNEMTLTPVDGGTLLVIVITYPSAEARDAILGTGMVDGMETSYSRLESLLPEITQTKSSGSLPTR
ncbi:hypothetical protein GCM10009785_22310 [Brooklawnia cerclae]|uniref:Uncharacterized protein YndB with AHSA1/START domain n=1 Tax=Brooklawnia cerclae TaxID=349934 RepID=A0ABX0SJ99_9ACTN|nr:SRPBCC family protein [Brooklawnia cerclae]NIH57135.1 uncharacterized protein YndB with AHSA1/START domain [Brooklawnia cerclae]